MTELWQSLLVVITNISLLFTTAPTGDGQTGDGHGSKQGHEWWVPDESERVQLSNAVCLPCAAYSAKSTRQNVIVLLLLASKLISLLALLLSMVCNRPS